eukprot:13212427-Ditylum_brightwellii.AAC.1
MVAHPSFMEPIKAREAAHDKYVQASMPPFTDMRVACMNEQVRETEYCNCLHEVDGYANGTHPLVFAAKANCKDTPNFWQATNFPDAHLFVEAMQVEMDQMDKLGAWELINESEVLYVSGVRCNVIESTWVLKVKITPDGAVKTRRA